MPVLLRFGSGRRIGSSSESSSVRSMVSACLRLFANCEVDEEVLDNGGVLTTLGVLMKSRGRLGRGSEMTTKSSSASSLSSSSSLLPFVEA